MVSGRPNDKRSLKIWSVRCWLFILRRNAGIRARMSRRRKDFATNNTNEFRLHRFNLATPFTAWCWMRQPAATALTPFSRLARYHGQSRVASLKQAVATLVCIVYDNSWRLYYKTRQTCKRPLVHWYKKHSSFTFLCKMRPVHWYSFWVIGPRVVSFGGTFFSLRSRRNNCSPM